MPESENHLRSGPTGARAQYSLLLLAVLALVSGHEVGFPSGLNSMNDPVFVMLSSRPGNSHGRAPDRGSPSQ